MKTMRKILILIRDEHKRTLEGRCEYFHFQPWWCHTRNVGW